MNLEEEIDRHGYAVVRNVLSVTEIDRLRRDLSGHFKRSWSSVGLGKHQPNAAVEIPSIAWVFTHAAIISALREAYGGGNLVFTGNADAHMNMLSWWHKDTSENRGGCFSGDYFSFLDSKVYRVGLYLQDHERRPGLTVRKGSQNLRSLTEGATEALQTRIGDIVIFDIRLTHAGQFADPIERILLRASQIRRLTSIASVAKNCYQRLTCKPQKLSIFFTYGMRGRATKEYCDHEFNAKIEFGGALATSLPNGLVSQLKACGVEFDARMERVNHQ